MEDWHDFFAATAGAAAALIGLIFVGLSISLDKILKTSSLPNRAKGAIVLLSCILIISVLGLVPQHRIQWFGIEILLIGVTAWLYVGKSDFSNIRQIEKEFRKHYFIIALVNQAALLTYIVCGLLIVLKIEVSLLLIVPAFILSFLKSALDSWVLLIEINR